MSVLCRYRDRTILFIPYVFDANHKIGDTSEPVDVVVETHKEVR